MDNRIDRRSTQWDFLGLLAKIGVPVAALAVLFLLARKGDQVAILMLVAVGVLLLLALGLVAALAIMDRMAAMEQRRFNANLRENLIYMEQVQRVQNRQLAGATRTNRDLLAANQRLSRMLPTGETLDVDALSWDDDLIDVEL